MLRTRGARSGASCQEPERVETGTLCDDEPSRSSGMDATIIFMESVGIQVNTFLDASIRGPSMLDVIKDDRSLRIATGVENLDILHAIVKCCRLKSGNHHGDVERNVIITLMKLKHDLSYSLLGILFRLSVSTVSSIFCSTVSMLGNCLSAAITWPSVEEVRRNMPKCFAKFQKTRVVLDCTEFSIECSKCLRCRLLTYSNYKGQATCKVMIGVSPAGLITAPSVPWGGRASDKIIFKNSELVQCLEPYVDSVMVDKGFHIELELLERGVELVQPPFLRQKEQLSKAQAETTAEIAAARVHVERVIGRMKQFKILNGKIQQTLLPYMENILRTVCGITNLSRPIMSDDKFL